MSGTLKQYTHCNEASLQQLQCRTLKMQTVTRSSRLQAKQQARACRTAQGRCSSLVVRAQQQAVEVDRRQVLGAASLAVASAFTPLQAIAAKAPKGFNPSEDLNDGYKFLYPFGWQEVSVNGVDVLYKDVVEALESVSVTLTKTDKKDITEFGDIQTVAETLAKDVLTSPNNEVKVLSTTARDLNGRNYYEFEFTATNPRYTRHQLAVVAAANGTFYTLTTGCSEKRWGKMKDRLQTSVRSFQLTY